MISLTLHSAENRLRLRGMIGEPSDKVKSTFARRIKENLNDFSKADEFAERYDAFAENRDLDACIEEICEHIAALKEGRSPMSREQIEKIAASLKQQAE